MGFLRKLFISMHLKSINPNKFVDDIERTYSKCRAETPNMDPHYYLAQTWLTFMGSLGNKTDEQSFQVAAFPTTHLVACIPHPQCARALGLFLLHRENPNALKKFPLLLDDFNILICKI